MKTRIVSLVIVLMMLLCSIAAAEEPVNPKGVFPIVDEPITLTVWCNLPAQRAENIETNDATLYLEEKTGIHLVWRKIGTNEAAEQLRVMMAADTDLPDIACEILFQNGISKRSRSAGNQQCCSV